MNKYKSETYKSDTYSRWKLAIEIEIKCANWAKLTDYYLFANTKYLSAKITFKWHS